MFSTTFYRICAFSVLLLVLGVSSQKRSKCGSQTECSACLQQSDCIWCMRTKLTTSSNRNESKDLNHCIPRERNATCSEADVVDPPTRSNIIKDKPLISKSGDSVQMKPQEVMLTLRVGQTVNVTFQYLQAKDFPVDLYYIIDNSNSMSEHKAKLSALGTELTETMAKITNDFRIGFGSFIDKAVAPYVSAAPNTFKNPCPGCRSPYGFKNHLSLTSNFKLFSKKVNESQLSGNQDAPEGGFDAIVQTIVCEKQIGWRPQARHIILFSSDAEFHIAGDGKLGGIFEPNDAKCYMKNNEYQGLEKDYPSISHLSSIIKEHNVNIIFAIVKSKRNVLKSYKLLSEHLSNTETDGLDAKSSNVVQLVKENYNKIVGSVTLDVNSTRNIHVKLTSHCKNPIRNGCEKVRLGEVLDFTASITLLDCAETSSLPTFISIKPDAIRDSLVVQVNPICSCPCDSVSDPSFKRKSEKCGGKGDLVCGLCKCTDGNHGSNCECDKRSPIMFNDTNCREKKSDFTTCSSHGTCQCGKCECWINPRTGEKYGGKFCECDDDSCERENGELCNGKGKCECGKCNCFDGWTGTSCGCRDQTELCILGGKGKEVCSGRGTCECGRCKCNETFTGTHCELCPTCADECSKLKDCVQCKAFHMGTYDRNECKSKCSDYDITMTNVLKKADSNEKICRMVDQNKCEVIFTYSINALNHLTITVQKEKNCEPNIIVWVLAVIGLVLFIGFITLLIWKIATLLHDAREYAKFMNEQKASRWHRGENPLYKGATTTFHNPHFQQ